MPIMAWHFPSYIWAPSRLLRSILRPRMEARVKTTKLHTNHFEWEGDWRRQLQHLLCISQGICDKELTLVVCACIIDGARTDDQWAPISINLVSSITFQLALRANGSVAFLPHHWVLRKKCTWLDGTVKDNFIPWCCGDSCLRRRMQWNYGLKCYKMGNKIILLNYLTLNPLTYKGPWWTYVISSACVISSLPTGVIAIIFTGEVEFDSSTSYFNHPDVSPVP